MCFFFYFPAPFDPTYFATGFQWHARPLPADAADAFEGFRHLGRGAPRLSQLSIDGLVGVFFI